MAQVNHGFDPDLIKQFCQKHMQGHEESPPSNASSSSGLVQPFLQPSALQPAIPSPEKDQVAKAAEPPKAEATEAEAEPMGSALHAIMADESQKVEPEIPTQELMHDMLGVYNLRVWSLYKGLCEGLGCCLVICLLPCSCRTSPRRHWSSVSNLSKKHAMKRPSAAQPSGMKRPAAAQAKANTTESKKKQAVRKGPFGCIRCRGNQNGCTRPGFYGLRLPSRAAWRQYMDQKEAEKAKSK